MYNQLVSLVFDCDKESKISFLKRIKIRVAYSTMNRTILVRYLVSLISQVVSKLIYGMCLFSSTMQMHGNRLRSVQRGAFRIFYTCGNGVSTTINAA